MHIFLRPDMNRLCRTLLAVLVTAALPAARAAVVDASPNGFRIRHVVQLAAQPEQVFTAITRINKWWDPEHTYSGNAANLTFTPAAGACFCERLPTGGSVQHLQVVNVQPGKRLVLSGALGPLQALGVAGAVAFTLKPAERGTELTFTYNVGGNLGDSAATIPTAVDQMWQQQLQRLKAFIERGAVGQVQP